MPEENHWLVYKGSKVCHHLYKCEQQDEQPYIILIHGFLASSYSFRKMISLLVKDFHVITLDLPPFGKSDRSEKFEYSYHNLAELVIFLMDTYSISRAFLVGHSMGGEIALNIAFSFPSRVTKLFLLAPSSYMKKADIITISVSQLPFSPFLMRKLFKRRGVAAILKQCVYNPSILTIDMLNAYKEPFSDNAMYSCLAKFIHDREGDLPINKLRQIQTECIIFWGKEDSILPITIGYQLVQDLPKAALYPLEEAGHLLPEERPVKVCQLISSLSKQITN